jgi:hypothetical protein
VVDLGDTLVSVYLVLCFPARTKRTEFVLLRPLYDESNDWKGYESAEVVPELARDFEGWKFIDLETESQMYCCTYRLFCLPAFVALVRRKQ